METLADRVRALLKLTPDGMTSSEIGKALGISAVVASSCVINACTIGAVDRRRVASRRGVRYVFTYVREPERKRYASKEEALEVKRARNREWHRKHAKRPAEPKEVVKVVTPKERPAAEACAFETVEQFVARGGVIQVLPWGAGSGRLEVLEDEYMRFFENWHNERRKREAMAVHYDHLCSLVLAAGMLAPHGNGAKAILDEAEQYMVSAAESWRRSNT